PDAVDLAEARRPANPHLDLTGRPGGGDVVEAECEGQFAVRFEVQVTDFIGDRATQCRENRLPGSTLPVGSRVTQRRRQIEGDNVGRVEGGDRVDVFCADRRRPVGYALADGSFMDVRCDICGAHRSIQPRVTARACIAALTQGSVRYETANRRTRTPTGT